MLKFITARSFQSEYFTPLKMNLICILFGKIAKEKSFTNFNNWLNSYFKRLIAFNILGDST